MFNLKKALIPCPKKIEDSGEKVKIASFAGAMPCIKADAEDVRVKEAVQIIEKRLTDMAQLGEKSRENEYVIVLKQDKAAFDTESDEAYFVKTDEHEAVLCGASPAGVFYAAVTFCSMLFECAEDIFAPLAYISDYPDFKYRGQFMECRYGSEFMTKQDWFDLLDYMAQMKSNQLTIGVYGCWSVQYDERKMEYLYVPIKKYPSLKTPKNIKYFSVEQNKWIHKDNLLPSMFEEDFLGEIIAYGKRKNITVKPLFNSLGHNTLVPGMIPEISAKNEDGKSSGFGFCTNNEKTYEVMFGIYDEIIERYLLPNGIHDIEIGLDEVGKQYICHCEKCDGKAHSQLMTEYIIKLCKYLKAKGMKRIYIYHDMLYHEFNIVDEKLKERFIEEGIYDEVVLDWWTYEDPMHLFWDKPQGVNNLFHSVMKPDTGYYNWAIPTENNDNIRACTKMAKELGFEGIESYSSMEYCYDKNYLTLADVSWNSENVDNPDEFDERYAFRCYGENTSEAVDAFKAMSDIMKDETHENYMNRVCYKFEYYFFSYKKADRPYPQNFPGGAYKLIEDDEAVFLPYLEFLKKKSKAALEFFEGNGSSTRINNIWRLNARHYYTISDEYLTLYTLYKEYNRGEKSESDVLKQLDRLILQREALMLLAEKTRIAATSYMYLRNMSIFRQYMTDIRDYFKKEAAAGRKPRLDMCDLSYLTGDKLRFLQ